MAFELTAKQQEHRALVREKEVVLAEGGGRCFVPSQRIATPLGPVEIQHLSAGHQVLSVNESTGQIEPKPIQQVYRFDGNKKRMVRVCLSTGETIVGTEDHEVFFDGGWHTLKTVLESFHGRMETDS